MADQEQLKILRQGKDAWSEWIGRHMDIQPDLRNAKLANADLSHTHLFRADLSGADLSGSNLAHSMLMFADLSNANLYTADLSGANLRCANLRGATLRATDLGRAILDGAHLDGADLHFANLSNANLSDADLCNATITYANLNNANLDNTDWQGAKIQGTIFDMVDLRSAKGLVEIVHTGPSPVTLYTVQLPQDGSALHFLRGTGVPDEWIDDYRAHMMHPIQYHSLFISYSSKDETFVNRLYNDLQAHGVRCWFAPEDLKIGDKVRQRIGEAIHLQDKLLLLLSEHSIASIWVENEVEAALEKEDRQKREVLFPVRVDETILQTSRAWASTLRQTRHIGDFTRWTDPQAYQQAFERLLRDLQNREE